MTLKINTNTLSNFYKSPKYLASMFQSKSQKYIPNNLSIECHSRVKTSTKSGPPTRFWKGWGKNQGFRRHFGGEQNVFGCLRQWHKSKFPRKHPLQTQQLYWSHILSLTFFRMCPHYSQNTFFSRNYSEGRPFKCVP